MRFVGAKRGVQRIRRRGPDDVWGAVGRVGVDDF